MGWHVNHVASRVIGGGIRLKRPRGGGGGGGGGKNGKKGWGQKRKGGGTKDFGGREKLLKD